MTKLATIKDGTRDGALVVVSNDLSRAIKVHDVAQTLQSALDDWKRCTPRLDRVYLALNESAVEDRVHAGRYGRKSCSPVLHERNDASLSSAFKLDLADVMAPLPRAYQWADASAYLSHVERARKARGAPMPPGAETEPLMYQGGSDSMLSARDDILVADESWGIDLEGEVGAITDDVPMGVAREKACDHVRLLVLINDVSLRNLTPVELAKGFGFFNSKSWTAFSPVAVTPDELGEAWDGRRLHLPLVVSVNGKELGRPNTGRDMTFDFGRLIEHAARTRPLGAGTIIGSGTVSNRDRSAGFACLTEKRAVETVDLGKPETPFLHFGDRVTIEMLDNAGRSIFGTIDQVVVPFDASSTNDRALGSVG